MYSIQLPGPSGTVSPWECLATDMYLGIWWIGNEKQIWEVKNINAFMVLEFIFSQVDSRFTNYNDMNDSKLNCHFSL